MESKAPTTLVDRLGRPIDDLRISVIDRCNFRCSFCMPADQKYVFLPKRELLSFEELERLTRVFVGLGVRKIRITGGEPLLRRDLDHLVGLLADVPGVEDLALTTNGALLKKLARPLRDAGLHRVTVSLESLREDRFSQINGVGHSVASVLEGIEEAQRVGLDPVKLNMVVMKGANDDEVADFAADFKARGVLVRFIEFMDVGTLNEWDPSRVVSAGEILDRIAERFDFEPVDRARGSDVAKRWRYTDDGAEFGIIASITEPFCGACSRARLSADGSLFTCLFGASGRPLKALLRQGASDEELREALSDVWRRRSDRYSEQRAELQRPKEASGASGRRVEMFRIGG